MIPQTGQLYERTFQTLKGPIDVLAEIAVEGSTITLGDIIVYGRTDEPLIGLTKEVFAARRAIVEEAKAHGFKKLRFTGRRVETSSSARPGKEVDVTIDLSKH